MAPHHLLLGWVLAVSLVGCGSPSPPATPAGSEVAGSEIVVPPLSPPPVASVAPPSEPRPDEPRTASDERLVGVPACDAYLAQMRRCMTKLPAGAQEAVEQGLVTTRDAWIDAAANTEARPALKSACRAALDALSANRVCE